MIGGALAELWVAACVALLMLFGFALAAESGATDRKSKRVPVAFWLGLCWGAAIFLPDGQLSEPLSDLTRVGLMVFALVASRYFGRGESEKQRERRRETNEFLRATGAEQRMDRDGEIRWLNEIPIEDREPEDRPGG